MSNLKDLTGQKFALLTVISRVENDAKGKAYWKCLCDCGKTTIVSGSNLRSGAVKKLWMFATQGKRNASFI